MSRRLTTEEFKEKLYNKVKDSYELIDEYIDSKTKIRFIHKKCGNIVKIKPMDILKGRGCHFCNKKEKYTTDSFKEKVKDMYNRRI